MGRTLWKPWLRAAVIVLVSLVLGVTVVAIWWTPEERLWAGGMYLLTCGLFGLAVLGALFSRGRWREVCIGAGLFGVVYLYMALPHSRIPHREEPRIEFVTDQFLNALRPLVPLRSSRIVSKARILEALERPIAMRFIEETPLEDVLKYIAMATSTPDHPGIPIYVAPAALQAAERTLQSTVSIDLQGVPLKTTLRLCLEQLGLVYRVEDGCLQITIEDLIEDREDTRLESDDPFLIVGHCLLALIAAGIGGVLALLVAAASRDRPGRTRADDALRLPLGPRNRRRSAPREVRIMRKIRFTIGGLMAVVLVLAIGLAALRIANGTWAGLVLLLTHGMLGLAILGVILCKGAERAWWLGFAVFEWGYLNFVTRTWGLLIRGLPTLNLLEWLRSKYGLVPDMTSNPRFDEGVAFAQIGHCLWALLAGILGGVLARLSSRQQPRVPGVPSPPRRKQAERPGSDGSGRRSARWRAWSCSGQS